MTTTLRYKARNLMNPRLPGLFAALFGAAVLLPAQGGDQALRAKAATLFGQGAFADALPLYTQLVSLTPADRDLNFRLGACMVESGDDKDKAVGFLKYAVEDPSTSPLSWFYLGRAYHLTYRFKDALAAYQHFRGTGDRKLLSTYPVDALEKQCRNGQNLLANLKEVNVHSKVEVGLRDFFRFYDLSDVGGRIVVTPDELRTSLDRKNGYTSLIHLPDKGGPIYFSSYGKDGRTGRDIYRTELLPDGRFAEPMRLAGYINTDQDEDYPFMAADGRTFYFCSKGHSSMGGFDVFRSLYERGSDVFGPPQNMDFAVNTPDDDIFYLVDPAGGEACFASARSSTHGQIHVYRVSTRQQPVTITILKGTFASEVNVTDRAARIVVEDAVTHERVSEVRTDINGSYILNLPRTGRYKFMVEAGPSGRTHVGMVDVPRTDSPKAYRQELTLVQVAGAEKLMIRNYFDEPLPDDLIALALDEIRRRARLDVTAPADVVAEAPSADPSVEDLLKKAGLPPEVDRTNVAQLAEREAKALEQQAGDLGAQREAALAVALTFTSEAEVATREAGDLASRAQQAGTETERNNLMTEAAIKRAWARQAALQARAAQRSAEDLDAKRTEVARSATTAARNATQLRAALDRDDRKAIDVELQAMKARMDDKNRPGAEATAAEEARTNATSLRSDADRQLRVAQTQRDEQDELERRITRLERERTETRSRSRQEAIDRDLNTLREQRTAMDKETSTAFAKARQAERTATVAQAEHALLVQLAEPGAAGTGTDLSPQQVSELGRKIGTLESDIASLPIDERIGGEIEAQEQVMRMRGFVWELPAFQASMRDRPLTAARNDLALAPAIEGTQSNTAVGGTTGNVAPSTTTASTVSSNAPVTQTNSVITTTGGAADGAATTVPAQPSATADPQRTADASSTSTTTQGPLGTAGATNVVPLISGRSAQAGRDSSQDLASAAGTVVRPDEGVSPEQSGTASQDDRRFVLENERMELDQLRANARTKREREDLDLRIAAIDMELSGTLTAGEVVGEDEPYDGTLEIEAPLGLARLFAAGVPDQELERVVFPDFAKDRDRLASLPDVDERAAGLNGLELMMVDSIQAETMRQLLLLESDPSKADQVLPRVDRLRRLKMMHLQLAEEAIDMKDRRTADAATPDANARAAESRYVNVQNVPDLVYDSEVSFRTASAKEADMHNNADRRQIERLTARIDSMETLLQEMDPGKDRDRLRKRTDKFIDDRLILRTEMGQRMEFSMREEYVQGQDSLKRVRAGVVARGIQGGEPMAGLAQQLESDARSGMDQAKGLRRQADRVEDIMKRDDLFRQAYLLELQALRSLDKAITVSNFMLSPDFKPGMLLTYEAVEVAMFGRVPQEVAQADADAKGNTDRTEGEQAVPTTQAVDPVPIALLTTHAEPPTTITADTAVPVDAGVAPSGSARMLLLARSAGERSADLEMRSIAAADRANANLDAAAKARRSERESLTQLAMRDQQTSDSLHRASLLMADSASWYTDEARRLRDREALLAGLMRFYYLNSDEMLMVMEEPDHSRYFGARAKALEQLTVSADADREAQASRELAADLVQQAQTVLAGDGQSAATEGQRIKAAELNDRAVMLNSRADSLRAAAARQRGASNMTSSQAATLLQGMDPAKSTAIMAMEQRTRRVDAALSETLAGASEQPVPRTANDRPDPVPQPRTDASAAAASAVPADTWFLNLPEELVDDIFEMKPATTKRTSAIPLDVKRPQGVVYAVQVGAFRKPIPLEAFSDLEPVMGEQAGEGLVRYTAGMFMDLGAAIGARDKVRVRGYRDAFVVVYVDGERVSFAEAERRLAAKARPAQDVAVLSMVPLAPTRAADRTAPQPSTDVARTEAARPFTAVIAQPAAPVATTTGQEADAAEVLARYPSTATEIVSSFVPDPAATDYYNVPGAAPARQVEVIRGLFFTVQVGVYSKPVALDKLFGITPLNSERTETGKIRYTTGIHRDMEAVRVHRLQAVGQGVADAFITAYLNGKRIPLQDARALLARHGQAILVDPSLVTP